MPTDERVYWDSCVFLSYINDDQDRVPTIGEILQQAASGKLQIITSTVTIVEAAQGAEEQAKGALSPEIEQRISKLWLPGSAVMLVEFYAMIAEAARSLMRQATSGGWSLKPMDAIHLATAVHWHVSEFQTYDKKLEKYREIVSVPIVEPYVAQQQLPT
jgi:predicted nucleic acid-binding protein